MRKMGIVEWVLTALGVLFVSMWVPVFVNTMSESSFLTEATKRILWPLDVVQKKLLELGWDVLYPPFLLVAIFWIWVSLFFSIVFLVKRWGERKINKLPQILAEQQLAVVLRELTSQSKTTEIPVQARRSVVSLIKHYEKGVREMFDLKKERDCHMLWYVATDNPVKPQEWSKEGSPSDDEKTLVDWAFAQDWLTCRDDVQRARLYNGSEVEAVISARNVPVFQIGFVCLIYKKIRIPYEKMIEFRTASASLLMLGQMDNIREAMLQLTDEDWEAVGNP